MNIVEIGVKKWNSEAILKDMSWWIPLNCSIEDDWFDGYKYIEKTTPIQLKEP